MNLRPRGFGFILACMTSRYLRDGRAPIPENELTSRIMSSIRAKNTTPEVALRKALHASGLPGYRLHWKKAPGRPDITYPGRKLAIFVHGCYWHRCPHCNPPFPKTHKEFWEAKFKRNIERDVRKIEELEQEGWKVMVFWECQIRDNLQNCVDAIRTSLLK